jgi:exonuclease SbcD
VPPGRLYLANRPTFFRLADPHGIELQFVLLPYPTPACYPDETDAVRPGREEKNRYLQTRLAARLQGMIGSAAYRPDRQTVLMAHLHVRGANPHRLFQITEEQDVLFNPGDLLGGFAYNALGHIHQAQALGEEHVRYCGSIDRLSLDERDYVSSVAVFEVGEEGRVGDVRLLPLDATPIYEVILDRPAEEIPHLAARYPDHERALVKYTLTWQAGESRDEFLRKLDHIFPRWYHRDLHERGADLAATRHASLAAVPLSSGLTARHFVAQELDGDSDRDDVLALLDNVLTKVK